MMIRSARPVIILFSSLEHPSLTVASVAPSEVGAQPRSRTPRGCQESRKQTVVPPYRPGAEPARLSGRTRSLPGPASPAGSRVPGVP
eukprot:758359-Hanusia_phi.AAC.1